MEFITDVFGKPTKCKVIKEFKTWEETQTHNYYYGQNPKIGNVLIFCKGKGKFVWDEMDIPVTESTNIIKIIREEVKSGLN